VSDTKKGVLVGQKITIYKESIELVTKYQHELKKIGSELSEKTSLNCLQLLKSILDELNKITQ
jgi:myo-inositol-1-phosphate synthase